MGDRNWPNVLFKCKNVIRLILAQYNLELSSLYLYLPPSPYLPYCLYNTIMSTGKALSVINIQETCSVGKVIWNTLLSPLRIDSQEYESDEVRGHFSGNWISSHPLITLGMLAHHPYTFITLICADPYIPPPHHCIMQHLNGP